MSATRCRRRLATLMGAAFVLLGGPSAEAVPTLQLYIEGSKYESSSESWVSEGDVFKLWVLGDVSSFGPIFDVKLTIAFPVGLDPKNIKVTGTTATKDTTAIGGGVLPGADPDPSPSTDPPLVASPLSALSSSGNCDTSYGTVLTLPCKGDGQPLAKHGEYGPVQWIEFGLGNFTETDSPIGDFIDAFPTSFPTTGQINAYTVAVNQGDGVPFPAGTLLHVDAFDHVVQNNNKLKYVFAPFSHDAVDAPGPAQVPQPDTAVLVGVCLAGAWAAWRLRGRRSL